MLRYLTATLTAFAFAGSIGVFAQQPPQQPPPPQEPEKPAPASATLSGCVQEAKTTDGGTAYILNKAVGGTAQVYVLAGSAPTDLAKHVNHKVEVTGQVQEPPAPAADAPKDPKVIRPPLVTVESVKMLAETCQ